MVQGKAPFQDFLQIDNYFFPGGEGEGWCDHQKQEKCAGKKGEIDNFSLSFKDIFLTLTFSQHIFLILTSSLFQVWMCEVVTPVPASKLWAKLQVFISNFSLRKGRPYFCMHIHV